MNALDPRDVQALGFSLLHFVWQGMALAALLAGLNLLLRHAAPQVRYLLAAATLGAMLVVPMFTFEALRRGAPEGPAGPAARVGESPQSPGSGGDARGPATGSSSAATLRTSTAAWVGTGLRLRLEPWLPVFVSLWCAGVLVLSLRTLGGFALVQRLKRSKLCAPPPLVSETVGRLREALRVTAAVQVFESALVHAPTVIGCLRPVVLVPASAITGLTPQQLELILAHELAHIQRRDYLVNLLQTAVETLLFYHPAVFWVSGRMRVEREHCCDDLAVAAGGSPVRYARALADLQGLCAEAPALAMAANGASLLERIARLVQPPRPLSAASRGLSVVLVLMALGLVFGVGVSFVGGPSPRLAHAAAVLPPEEGALSAPELPQTSPSETTDEKCERCPAPVATNETPEAESECDSECADCNSDCAPCDSDCDEEGEAEVSPEPEPRPVTRAVAEPRAFPLERILELARAGVTPEFVDEAAAGADVSAPRIRPANFAWVAGAALLAGTLTGPAEAEALRGVWTAERSKWRVANAGTATIVQLSLRRVGVKGHWDSSQSVPLAELSGLTEAQLDAPTAETRFAWKRDAGTFSLEGRFQAGAGAGHFAFAADPGYVADMGRRGYGGIDAEKALSLALHDVSRRFIDDLAGLGYERVALDQLVALRIHGASAEYVRGLAALGYRRLPVDQLVAFRIHGVSAEFVRELKSLGYARLEPDQLVSMRIHGVSPEQVKDLKALGYSGVPVEQLVSLRIHGVTTDFIRRVQGRSGKTVTVDRLVSMRIHGQEPE